MRCSSCKSKNPKNQQIGSNLLFCNKICQFNYIGVKRGRSVLIIKTSDEKTIELDALGPFESSKTIKNFLEDASDNEITLPITSNAIKNIMDPSILGLQDRIEITLAYNYLDMDQDLWLTSMRSVFSFFFKSDQEILTFLDFRVYYDLPSDGGFDEQQNISLYKNQELVINNRYPNGIQTKYPSILNFSNDQLIKFFNYALERINAYAWWNNFRCSHIRFYNIITEHMKKERIKLHTFYKESIILPAEIFIQWEAYFKPKGFKNIYLLFKNLDVQFDVTKETIEKLLQKCIVDHDYTLLYKVTYDWKFKEILATDP
jgi:hypothetical protein